MTLLLPAFTGAPEPGHVYHCDALTLLRAMPDASVDLIATDPPYGIGYVSSWTTRNDGGIRVTSSSFGADIYDDTWVSEASRVLKATGALYICSRWDVLHLWSHAAEYAGLTVAQRIVWDKRHWGMGDLRYFGSQTEDILFCVKPMHRLTWTRREGNLWQIWRGLVWADGNEDNPTQKPVDLMERMIELSSDEGDLVIDPFCGSGTTAVAARRLNRSWITGDISPYQVAIARDRLRMPFAPKQREAVNDLSGLPLFAETVP